MPKRQYTDAERAACLAMLEANGGNMAKTARQCGVPRKTLTHWVLQQTIPEATGSMANGFAIASPPEKPPPSTVASRAALLVEISAEGLVQAFDRIAAKATGSIQEADLKVANWREAVQAATVAAIAVDKRQLLSGKATTISGQELTDDERLARSRELAERGRSRRLGLSDAGRAG